MRVTFLQNALHSIKTTQKRNWIWVEELKFGKKCRLREAVVGHDATGNGFNAYAFTC